MEQIIDDMKNYTDGWPWYWFSYGQGEYMFATVEAYPEKDGDPFPEPGSQLTFDDESRLVDSNGTVMVVESNIAVVERQNGDTICEFIAKAHAALVLGV